MHNSVPIRRDLLYLGGNDRRLSLFESAYPVPRGVSYNSYLLLDEKTVLFDTVDAAVGDAFLENLAFALGGRQLDYLVVHHVEPDHSATFRRVTALYPSVTVICNRKSADMLLHYFGYEGKTLVVKEGDTLPVGRRTLSFVFAPMVHWPEVMMTYVPEEGVLFSADAFGTFGALGGSVFADEADYEHEFLSDARRYYFNIVGKYGAQVQAVLKKAKGLSLSLVCPLHGPVWRNNIPWLLETYDLWSRYEPETRGLAVFYASVYGHTKNAAEIVASAAAAHGVPVRVYDTAALHPSELLAEAFRYSHLVFASTTYNNGIFVSMERLLSEMKAHNFQNRAFAVVENGSWSPQAGELMLSELSAMKRMTQIGEKVTLISAVDGAADAALRALGTQIAEDILKFQ